MDLLTYQLAKENEFIHSANIAYARGNIDGAIGFLVGLAAQKGITLPHRPLRKPSQLDNTKSQSRYYFECLRVIGEHDGKTIDNVRATYGNPFVIKTKREDKPKP